MLTVSETRDLREHVSRWRSAAETIALVPTMGNLHAGHMELVAQARQRADHTVVSIFVNPMQFLPGEDYQDYPRTLQHDVDMLTEAGVDLLFTPPVEELYGPALELTTRIEVPALDGILCGASRPGHFAGVATVVMKLFNLAQPHVAMFGDKDFQQLLLIKRMVADLSLPIEIVGVATVRETDGLALSSRNAYLTAAERRLAPSMYQLLTTTAEALSRGEAAIPALEESTSQALTRRGFRPDYVSIRRAADLSEPLPTDRELVILGAAWLGETRLIDHLEFVR